MQRHTSPVRENLATHCVPRQVKIEKFRFKIALDQRSSALISPSPFRLFALAQFGLRLLPHPARLLRACCIIERS